MNKDSLGDRMKVYEGIRRDYLIPNSYSIIRIDGKAFHTYTKGLKQPYDEDFCSDMDETAKYLLANIQGSRFAYVQSDEISILIEDLYKEDKESQLWFGGNIQKIVSVSASLATGIFNKLRILREANKVRNHSMSSMAESVWDNNMITSENIQSFKLANFDSRVFNLPNYWEVYNYFYWRWLDNDRNSIQRYGQNSFSHKELEYKNCGDIIHKLLVEKDIDYTTNCPPNIKYGRFIVGEFVLALNLKNQVDKDKILGLIPKQ